MPNSYREHRESNNRRASSLGTGAARSSTVKTMNEIGENELMKDYLQTLRTSRAKLGVIAAVIVLVLSACGGGAAKPTEVKISAPVPGTIINVGQGTVIQGEATGDSITRVEVVIDGKAYASLSTPDKTKGVPNFPVSVPWTPMSAGTHAIQLRAFGLEDKLLAQSEPLVMDAKPSTVAATATSAVAAKPTAAVATATPSGNGQPAATAAATTAGQATAAPSGSGSGPNLSVTNDFVNVREGPNVGYKLLGRLDKGQSAPVRGKSQDGKWWQISYASGTNGVGWVFGEYVQANSAADSVPVASAPPLPTSPPAPPAPVVPTSPPPTAIVVQPTAAASLPTTGSKGQLKVNQNPVASNGSVNAYWNVSNIQGIWFDKGDGAGFQAASGSQTVNVAGITSQRLLQLKWKDSSGNETIDQLTVYISGQVVATTSSSTTCTSSDPAWQGANTNYPFCVATQMDWTDGSGPVRYFSYAQNAYIGVRWNIYGVGGVWVLIQADGTFCPTGSGSREVAVSGNGTYSWNVNEFTAAGGYKVSMKILRNDGQYVMYNEKYMCIGVSANSAATNTPVPPATAAPSPTATSAVATVPPPPATYTAEP
jgi:hypothetical protein